MLLLHLLEISLYGVHKDIGVEEMGQYIKDKGVHYRELVKTIRDDSVNGSFKLTVAFSDGILAQWNMGKETAFIIYSLYLCLYFFPTTNPLWRTLQLKCLS